jgi:arsenate reductase
MSEKTDGPKPRHICFMCVANSARSQMAEGWGNKFAGPHVTIYSAGSEPKVVNPLAIEVMKEVGVSLLEHHSKSIEELPIESIDTVITLCAEEVCPVFPGPLSQEHWPHPDPADSSEDAEEQKENFRRVRDLLKEKIKTYLESC